MEELTSTGTPCQVRTIIMVGVSNHHYAGRLQRSHARWSATSAFMLDAIPIHLNPSATRTMERRKEVERAMVLIVNMMLAMVLIDKDKLM